VLDSAAGHGLEAVRDRVGPDDDDAEPGGSVAPAYVAFPAYQAWSEASAPWKFVAATADEACASARVTEGAADPSLRDCAAKRYPPTATETSRSVTPSTRLMSISYRRAGPLQ
jgi:hypothetical protein